MAMSLACALHLKPYDILVVSTMLGHHKACGDILVAKEDSAILPSDIALVKATRMVIEELSEQYTLIIDMFFREFGQLAESMTGGSEQIIFQKLGRVINRKMADNPALAKAL